MTYPDKLKGLHVYNVAVPKENTIGVFDTKSVVRNKEGEIVIDSDNLSSIDLEYLCRAMNKINWSKHYLFRFAITGDIVTKRDGRMVKIARDGTATIQPVKTWTNWLNRHKRNRQIYTGQWEPVNLNVPVHIEIEYNIPSESKPLDTHELTISVIALLRHIKLLKRTDSKQIKSINTRVVAKTRNELRTFVTIRGAME